MPVRFEDKVQISPKSELPTVQFASDESREQMFADSKNTAKSGCLSWRKTFRGRKYSAVSYSYVVIAFLYATMCLTSGQQCQGSREVPNQEGIEEFAYGPYLKTCSGVNRTVFMLSK